MPWDRVHDEAEVLEHVISEELERLIAAKLGDPTLDPHGDPIPSAELELRERETARWTACNRRATGACSCESRTADPEMLAICPNAASPPETASRCSSASPLGGRCL